ncbi:unnamed protein product [Peniophora sp. CBMAI 1063]|nr:unnamed protein product [Peniophora sp. CBMAI 1063]
MADFIELSDSSDEENQTFDTTNWIGKGKTYNSLSAPPGLRHYIKRQLAIPPVFERYLPAENLSCSEFIQWGPPAKLCYDLVSSAAPIFSKCEPNGAVRHFLGDNRQLPPLVVLKDAEKRVRQAIVDGYRSFSDTRYNETYLPLWAIPFCRRVYESRTMQVEVERASDWLTRLHNKSNAADHALVVQARQLHSRLPRCGSPYKGGVGVEKLLPLLRSCMITDNLVDVLVRWSIDEAKARRVSSTYKGHGMEVWAAINKAKQESYWSDDNRVDPQFMLTIEKALKVPSGAKGENIIFPIYQSFSAQDEDDYGHFLLAEIKPDSRTFTLDDGATDAVSQLQDDETDDEAEFPLRLSDYVAKSNSIEAIPTAVPPVNTSYPQPITSPSPPARPDSQSQTARPDSQSQKGAETSAVLHSMAQGKRTFDVANNAEGDKGIVNPGPASPSKKRRKAATRGRPREVIDVAEFEDADGRLPWIRYDNDGRKSTSGNGRSQVAARKRQFLVEAGLKSNESARDAFRDKILALDADASFDPNDDRRVKHSLCGVWISCALNRPEQFRRHAGLCDGASPTYGMAVLAPDPSSAVTLTEYPCPGGGGARPRYKIVRSQYPGYGHGSFKLLSQDEQLVVLRIEEGEFEWTLERHLSAVRSASCKRPIIHASPSLAANKVPPCIDCKALRKLPAFKVARSRRFSTNPANAKYAPLSMQHELVASTKKHAVQRGFFHILQEFEKTKGDRSIFVTFADCALQGGFKGRETFIGLIEHEVQIQKLISDGKSKTGFRWSPSVKDWAHRIHIMSPSAFIAVQGVFNLPTPRTFQSASIFAFCGTMHSSLYRNERARQPRFPIGIDRVRTPLLLKEALAKLSFDGPVHLAEDDTDITASLDAFWSVEKDAYILVGTPGEPPILPDPDILRKAIQEGAYAKASHVRTSRKLPFTFSRIHDQLRVWTAQIACPGVPGIVVAAMPIAATIDASSLIEHQDALLQSLYLHDIAVCSMAADGAQKERSVQHHYEHSALRRPLVIPYPPDPSDEKRALHADIPLIKDALGHLHPLAQVTDPSHALKVFRSNCTNGHLLITVGEYTTGYRHFLRTQEEGGPLLRHDVVKADKQSDNTAMACFSSTTARWMHANRPTETRATVVLLAILSGLVNAYESREITMMERVEAVLRAYYLMEIWKDFCVSMDYPRKHHLMSAQALDVARLLVNGLLQLIMIFCDDFDGKYPLLPWLVGTRNAELTFSETRGIVKDFTALDFLYAVPKLFVKLRQRIAGIERHSTCRSNGYNHGLAHNTPLSPQVLARCFELPSQFEILEAAPRVYSQAASIAEMLSINVALLERAEYRTTAWPWILGEADRGWGSAFIEDEADDADYDCDADSDGGDDASSSDEEGLSHAELHALAQEAEAATAASEDQTEQLHALAYAAVVLSAEQDTMMESLPDMSDDMWQQDALSVSAVLSGREVSTVLGASLANRLPAVEVPGERATPSLFNIGHLLDLHQHLESEHTRRVVRKRTVNDGTGRPTVEGDVGIRRRRAALGKLYRGILSEMQGHHASQGMARKARLTGKSEAGNTQNATVTAGVRAGAPAEPQDPLCWALIFYRGYICLFEISDVYAKGGGKSGRYGFGEQVKSIAAATLISGRVHFPDPANGRIGQTFRYLVRPAPGALPYHRHNVSRYGHIKSYELLVVLSSQPSVDAYYVTLHRADEPYARALEGKEAFVAEALKDMNRRQDPTAGEDDGSAGEG